jgi:hypothetical protein
MADEDLLLVIGNTIFPGFVERPEHGNGLRLWVEGDPRDEGPRVLATSRYQTVLGAGQLQTEHLARLGQGSVRDESGNQWLAVGPAVLYLTSGGEVEDFATAACAALGGSPEIGNALRLNGRADRTAADYYMIHEYAQKALGGAKGVRDALGIGLNDQARLTSSANNLSPLEGGRHANDGTEDGGPSRWNLGRQREFCADLLRRWIRCEAGKEAG